MLRSYFINCNLQLLVLSFKPTEIIFKFIDIYMYSKSVYDMCIYSNLIYQR